MAMAMAVWGYCTGFLEAKGWLSNNYPEQKAVRFSSDSNIAAKYFTLLCSQRLSLVGGGKSNLVHPSAKHQISKSCNKFNFSVHPKVYFYTWVFIYGGVDGGIKEVVSDEIATRVLLSALMTTNLQQQALLNLRIFQGTVYRCEFDTWTTGGGGLDMYISSKWGDGDGVITLHVQLPIHVQYVWCRKCTADNELPELVDIHGAEKALKVQYLDAEHGDGTHNSFLALTQWTQPLPSFSCCLYSPIESWLGLVLPLLSKSCRLTLVWSRPEAQHLALQWRERNKSFNWTMGSCTWKICPGSAISDLFFK